MNFNLNDDEQVFINKQIADELKLQGINVDDLVEGSGANRAKESKNPYTAFEKNIKRTIQSAMTNAADPEDIPEMREETDSSAKSSTIHYREEFLTWLFSTREWIDFIYKNQTKFVENIDESEEQVISKEDLLKTIAEKHKKATELLISQGLTAEYAAMLEEIKSIMSTDAFDTRFEDAFDNLVMDTIAETGRALTVQEIHHLLQRNNFYEKWNVHSLALTDEEVMEQTGMTREELEEFKRQTVEDSIKQAEEDEATERKN